MTSPKIYIGTPIQSGAPMINYVISLIVFIKECRVNGWDDPIIYFRVGDSDIARARNAIVGRFLKSDCTDLVMIDADISWAPGALTRLINHKKDFVAGSYRGRTDEKDIYFILWPEKKEMFVDEETNYPLLKVDAISMGFCRLKRNVLEKLAEPWAGRWISDPLIKDEEFPWIIDFKSYPTGRYEEGYSLCKTWRETGGECWVDPGINLGHMGPKVFESNLMGFLERMQKMVGPQNDVQTRIEEAWLRGAPQEAAE